MQNSLSPIWKMPFFLFLKIFCFIFEYLVMKKRRTNNIDWIICCIGQCIITFWLFPSEAVTFIWQSTRLNRPIRMNKMNPNNRVRVDEIHRWSNCATVDPWTNYQIITYMHRKQFFSLFFLIFFHIFSSINYTYRMKVDFSRSIKCFIGWDGLHFSYWLLYKWLSYCDYLQITYWSMKNL